MRHWDTVAIRAFTFHKPKKQKNWRRCRKNKRLDGQAQADGQKRRFRGQAA